MPRRPNGDRKTATKTATASPRSGVRLPVGAHPGNTGGKKGRSGRKPIEFVTECARLADDVALPKIADYLQRMDPNDPAWRWCVEYVSRYTKSDAPKQVTHSGDDTNPVRFTLTIGKNLSAA